MRLGLSTKESRQKYQQAQIDNETAKGATVETYKDLKIVTRHQAEPRPYFLLLIFRGDAGHPIKNEYYRSKEHRARIIKIAKNNFDSRENYKAEQKAKGRRQSSQAQAAAAIREELKTNFPSIKFSVTSEGYSMGDNVNVNWIDGPTETEVEAITAKYQSGRFNSMEDIYEYSNSREDIPQTKYLFTNRKKSDEVKQILKDAVLKMWPGEGWQEDQQREREMCDIFRSSSIPAGAKVTHVERVKVSDWEFKDLLRFEAPAQPATTTEAATFEKVEAQPGSVQIIDYSEKAIAVIGDTRPVSGKLKSLGGKFNPRLSCGPGWIFPKTKLATVQAAFQAPDPEDIPEEPTAEEAEAIAELFEPVNQKPLLMPAQEPETFNYVG